MRNEFHGKTLEQAVRAAVGKNPCVSTKGFVSNAQLTCDEIYPIVSRLQGEIEDSLDEMENIANEIERRTRRLANQARNAAATLAVDTALIFTGVGTIVAAIRTMRLAIRFRGASKVALTAEGLRRTISAGFTRFEPLQEWIDIRSLKAQMSRHTDRVARHSGTIDQLWERYRTMGCDVR